MKCETCGKGPELNITLYRVNPKGERGKWACAAHVPKEYRPDPEVETVVNIIESDSATKH